MLRRSRRRRTWPRLLKIVVVGFVVLMALSLVTAVLENAGSQPALPMVLGGIIAVWLYRRSRRVRASVSRKPAARLTPGAVHGLDQIYALSPSEFEAFVRDVLGSLGYRDLRLNGGSGDLGVDIWGRTPQGQSAAIQCKRYSPHRKIGSPVIQTFIGMQKVHHGADAGVFVTTSGFTVDAMQLARQHNIWLIDGPALVQLQRSAGARPPRRFLFSRG